MFGLFMTFVFIESASFAKGNNRKGKFTYKQLFKNCEENGRYEGNKPPLDPSSKTQAQWKRAFKSRIKLLKKIKVFAPCKIEWDALSKQDLENILAYLQKGASDSDTPAKCQ